MSDQDIALMAHLMRRAGFGATRDEIEARVAKGYEATVEELLSSEEQEDCLLYTSPSPRDRQKSRMPSSA